MGVHRSKGSRGARMPDAAPARSRRTRLAFVSEAIEGETLEVPAYVVSQKKAKGKKGQLTSRRNVMKARMSMRAGVTSIGCNPGTIGVIVYTLTDKEKILLNEMGALTLDEAVDPVPLEIDN